MITLEQAVPGTEVVVKGEITKLLTGHYVEERLGLMLKSAKYPGGYPADQHFFIGQQEAAVTDAVLGTIETLPAVIFESIILDEKEPIKLTPQLIRDKSKALLDLEITSILDEPGLKAVKAAKQKIIKTRTTIERIEKAEKDKIKTRYNEDVKEVVDYAATLYAACKEGEDALQLKITTHENEKAAEALKIANAKKEKTEGRNTKMYALGMMFNGTAFFNFGKNIAQDVLHAMSDEKYAELLTGIEGLKLEQEAIGTAPAPVQAAPAQQQGSVGYGRPAAAPTPANTGSTTVTNEPVADRVYETAIYERSVPEAGIRVIITKGAIEAEPDALVSNERILESSYYVQVVR